jgi:diadenosine tetraphosphate (Ap4A) HIT family hydrolase
MDPSLFREVQHDWPFPSRIVHLNRRAFVIPGVGPQVYPYFLVLTRRHTLALASATPDERRDLIAALDWLLHTGIYPSSSLTVFEHGGCGGADSASCVDHAHLHVVDGKFDIQAPFAAQATTAPTVLSSEMPLPPMERYVFAGTYDGSGVINGRIAEGAFPKQFFRRLLGNIVGGPWNWRLKMHEEWVLQAVAELSAPTPKAE